MQKLLKRNLAALVLASLTLTIIAPPSWAQSANTQLIGNHRAFITTLTGTVEVKPVGQTSWTRATANREVKTGDRVRTAANSKCRIKVSDVGDFELIASSEMSVGNLQQVKTTARAFFMLQRTITRDDVGMDLKSGDVRSSFHRSEGRVGNYNVYTPVAVAGVRGTKFELDLEGGRPWYERLEEGKGDGDENSLTTIVLEGEVEVQGGTWTRSVSAGQQLTSTSGNAGNPTDADADRLRELQGTFTAAADKTPPTFDGAKSAERATDGAITVAWNAASDDSTAVDAIVYDLFEATTSRAQDLAAAAAVSNPGVTQMVIRGLSATAHYFIVRARDAAGNRDNNTREVAVPMVGVTGVIDQTSPIFEGAKSAVRAEDGSVILAWDPASDDSTSANALVYDIYQANSSKGQDFSAISAISGPGASNISIQGLPEDLDFYFIVRARDAAGNRDGNTNEVSVRVAGASDANGPAFGGAIAAEKLTTTTAKVEWLAASDDLSSPEEIVYDVYASKFSGAQDFTKATASSDSGATSLTLTGLEDGVDYYIVVRARDAAGNRDANTEEVTTFVYTAADDFDTNAEIVRLNQELFKAYEEQNIQGFMDLVSPTFAGENAAGNALTYTTLYESLNNDFAALTSMTLVGTITSLTYYGEGRYGANATWNATRRFVDLATEDVRIGQEASFVWEGNRPFLLSSWSGVVPFALSRPDAPPQPGPGPLIGPAPTLISVTGIPDQTFTGDNENFAPYRITVTGSDFQEGAKVYGLEDGVWVDIESPSSYFSASVFFQSSTELFVDISNDFDQWEPTDVSPEVLSFKVENPDGQASEIINVSRTITPGPLRISNVTFDRPVLAGPDPNPYTITVEGYNFVGPFQNIEIKPSGGGVMVVTQPVVTFSTVTPTINSSGPGQPLSFTIQATMTGLGLAAGNFDLVITDARGQQSTYGFTVTSPTNIRWSSNMPLSADFPVSVGQTLTIDPGVTVTGTGFRVIVDGTLNATSATFDGVALEFNAGSNGILQGVTVQGTSTTSGAGILVSGGNVSITGGSLSSNPADGISVTGGNVTMNGTTLSGNTASGAHVTSGSLSLSSVSATSNGNGLSISGVAVTVNGGSFSSNTGHGIFVDGSATLTMNALTSTITGNGSDGINVTAGSTANLSKVSISGSPVGITSGGTVSLDGTTTIDGSTAGIDLLGGNLTTSGTTNNISSTSGDGLKMSGGTATITDATISAASGNGINITGGTLSLSGTNAIVENSGVGVNINGGASVTITSSAKVQNNSSNGVYIDGGANVTISNLAKVQGNSNIGVLAATCGTVLLDGCDILNNTSFGVSRTSPTPLGGTVHLTNVLLSGNNSPNLPDPDRNTTPTTYTSSQYQYLIEPPDKVELPR